MRNPFRNAGRLLLVVASVCCGSLLLASPASAACTILAYYDDGSAEATHDHDYFDDTSIKRLIMAQRPIVATGATLHMDGTSYGGCGSYVLLVNGAVDHTFGACGFWQVQPVNPTLLQPGLNTFEVRDTDGTWDTGIFFSVDTNNSGRSTMIANGIPRTGELMWRLSVSAVACL